MKTVKFYLVMLRYGQILLLLASAVGTTIALNRFAIDLDNTQYISNEYRDKYKYSVGSQAAAGVAGTTVALAVNLAGVALCTTWLVFTLSPARRAKASCCGNHASCITFRHDVGCDIAFAVLNCISLIYSAVMTAKGNRQGFSGIITSSIMMALFIATAVLSSKMGQAARREQESTACSTGFAAPAATAHVHMAAPPKAVQMV